MKKVLCPTLFFLVIFLLFSACAEREPGDTTADPTSPTVATVSGTVSATEPVSVDPAETSSDKPRFVLTPEQKERYEDLLVKAKEYTGNRQDEPYSYLNGVLDGRIDPEAPRLDAATALKIVEENDDFDTILKRFGEIQSFDYWGQGGTFWGEFWLDYTIADGKLFVPEKIYINFDSKIILDWRYEPDDPYSAPSDSRTIFPKQAP